MVWERDGTWDRVWSLYSCIWGKDEGRPEVWSVLSHPPRSGGAVTELGGGVMFGSDDEEVVLVGVGFVKFANWVDIDAF